MKIDGKKKKLYENLRTTHVFARVEKNDGFACLWIEYAEDFNTIGFCSFQKVSKLGGTQRSTTITDNRDVLPTAYGFRVATNDFSIGRTIGDYITL